MAEAGIATATTTVIAGTAKIATIATATVMRIAIAIERPSCAAIASKAMTGSVAAKPSSAMCCAPIRAGALMNSKGPAGLRLGAGRPVKKHG